MTKRHSNKDTEILDWKLGFENSMKIAKLKIENFIFPRGY